MSRPKNCVLLVKTPADWKPERFHSIPPSIESATFYARNLTQREAQAAAKVFNKAHLAPENFTGEWMLVIRALKGPKLYGTGPGQRPRSERREQPLVRGLADQNGGTP